MPDDILIETGWSALAPSLPILGPRLSLRCAMYGELLTFDDPAYCLPTIDRLEGSVLPAQASTGACWFRPLTVNGT